MQHVGAVMFVIKHRHRQACRSVKQNGGRAVGGHRNRVNPVVTVELRQVGQKELPVPLQIGMRPWRTRKRTVGTRDHGNFGQALSLDQGKLCIGLADVYDGDMCHGR